MSFSGKFPRIFFEGESVKVFFEKEAEAAAVDAVLIFKSNLWCYCYCFNGEVVLLLLMLLLFSAFFLLTASLFFNFFLISPLPATYFNCENDEDTVGRSKEC